MNERKKSPEKKRRSVGQKRILLLFFTIVVLMLSSNLGESRRTEPSLRGLGLNEAARQALLPDAANLSFEVFSYQTDAQEPLLRLTCYGLDLESGQWNPLRGGEARLDGQRGKLALRFDGSRVLWAAILNEQDVLFAEINPDEAALDLQYTSTFWWRRERADLAEGREYALAVQTVFFADAPEDAKPIDPRDAHDPALLQNREDVAAAYALTVQITDGSAQPAF